MKKIERFHWSTYEEYNNRYNILEKNEVIVSRNMEKRYRVYGWMSNKK